MTLKELRKKDVIRTDSGDNLGRVDDLEFQEGTAEISAVILYGRPRFFGLAGRQPDLSIPWENILQIGNDVIMVRVPEAQEWTRPRSPLHQFGI